MKKIMIWLIRLYRKYISPLKPPCCRFKPTCSAYALEAFQKRGFFVGLILTIGRILRCNPFFKGGYDPVPEKGLRNPKNIRETGDIHTDITDAPSDTDECKQSPQTVTEKDFSNDED